MSCSKDQPAPESQPAKPTPQMKAETLVKNGRTAKDQGELLLAVQRFQEATQIAPKNALAWANLASTYAEEGKLDDSIQAFQTACSLDPTHKGFEEQRDRLMALKAKGGKLPSVDEKTVRKMCSACHVFPGPKSLPRDAWAPVIASMHDMQGGFADVDPRAVVQWFRLRAPKHLEVPARKAGLAVKRLSAKKHILAPRPAKGGPAVAAIAFLDVLADEYPELFVTDMRNGKVLMGLPFEKDDSLYVIAHLKNPAHISAVDLNQDKRKDLLVADLGSFAPEVHTNGGIYWLKQNKRRSFETIPLYTKLGRVSDVKAADLDQDGDLDLVVAEYGSRLTGRILVLEQVSRRKNKPKFKLHEIDSRAGAINIQISDFNGDDRPDFAAVIAEHHETISLFVNEGKLSFQEVNVFRAPHPSWGYTGMTMADIDNDGDQDLIATNGDGYDAGAEHGGLLQPFHGVHVFENLGQAQFKAHEHLQFRGAHSVTAGDFDKDGDLDLLASAFQPFLPPEGRRALQLDSVVWFEQTGPYQFARHSVEAFNTEHAAVASGDFDLDGDVDFAVGVFTMPEIDPRSKSQASLWEAGPGKSSGEWVHLYQNLVSQPVMPVMPGTQP